MGCIIDCFTFCCEAIFNSITCCFRNKSSSDGLNETDEHVLQIIKLEYDDEKSSITTEKSIKQEYIPRKGLTTPEKFDRLDQRVQKNPKDETLIAIYQKLSPATISQKVSTELCSRIMDGELKNLTAYLEFTKILQDKHLIDQTEIDVIFSSCLSFAAEFGSVEILHQLMRFVERMPEDDQQYVLKSYPEVIELAAIRGDIAFIKTLTDYFCRIVPGEGRFFEQARESAVNKIRSDFSLDHKEKMLEALCALKYEVQKEMVVVEIMDTRQETISEQLDVDTTVTGDIEPDELYVF